MPSARPRCRRHFGSERGTALVEFALIAPLLFLLVFGIIEFGRALNYYNDLTQLAGQGARAAAVSRNPDGTAIGQQTDPNCAVNNLKSIQCEIAKTYPTDNELQQGMSVCLGTLNPDGSINGAVGAGTGTTPNVGDPITVRASFKFHFLTTFFGATITLSSTQTERLEAPATWQGGSVNQPQAVVDGVDACAATP